MRVKMADLPLVWKENCSKFPNILETPCTNSTDVRRRMVEHDFHPLKEPLDGATYILEVPEDGWILQRLNGSDVLFGFDSSAKCKLALYVNGVKTHEDCSGLSLEDGLPVSLMLAAELMPASDRVHCSGSCCRIKVVPEIPCTITCKALLLSNACIKQLYKQSTTLIRRGTILKRLQNPGEPIGSYFTFKHADLDKCGVSRYFTTKHGVEEEKQVLWFRATRAFKCEIHHALDTTDTWSGIAPYVCPGGEQILRMHRTFIDKKLNRAPYDLDPITEEEAARSQCPRSDQREESAPESKYRGWDISNIHEGITFVDDIAFVKQDHPIICLYNAAREDPLTEAELFGDTDTFVSSVRNVRKALDMLLSRTEKAAGDRTALIDSLISKMGKLGV